jgi:hypothetical protein
MDQDVGKDANGWEIGRQKRNISFGVNFGEAIQIHVSKRL